MASKVWEVMNDLEMVTSKICSVREIIDAAIDRIQEHQYDKAETMMSAAYEFLEYYLGEFDDRFKSAWKETVIKERTLEFESQYQYTDEELDQMCAAAEVEQDMKNIEEFLQQDRNSNFPGENTIDPVKKWVLPVVEDGDECVINFPDDLLEAANLKEGDRIEWIPQLDGSCLMRKISDQFIYESPDKGQTVYQRKFGTTRGYNDDVFRI